MARAAPAPALLLVPGLLVVGVLGAMLLVELDPLLQVLLVGASALLAVAASAPLVAGGSSIPWLRLRQLVLLALLLSLPMIRWEGPGNTAIPDAVLLAVVLLGLAALLRRPSVLPPRGLLYCWLAYVTAGLVASLNSPDTSRSLLTLSQDLFLLLFWIALHVILYDAKERIEIPWLVRIWLLVAAVHGLLLLLGLSENAAARELFSFRGTGHRGVGLFRDPNMAAHYLGLSLMLVPLARIPMRGWRLLLVVAAAACMLLGLAGSGSNGAKVALVAAVLTSAGARLMGRAGRSRSIRGLLLSLAAALAVLLLLVVGSWMLSPDLAPISTSDWSDAPRVLRLTLISYTLDMRLVVWRDAFDTFREYPLGLGPGVLGRTALSRADREAHSDLFAALAERGLPGLLALLCSVLVWIRLMLGSVESAGETTRERTVVTAARFGATAFLLVFGLSLDTLHFRHLWLAMAVLLPPAMGDDRRPQGREGSDPGSAGLFAGRGQTA